MSIAIDVPVLSFTHHIRVLWYLGHLDDLKAEHAAHSHSSSSECCGRHFQGEFYRSCAFCGSRWNWYIEEMVLNRQSPFCCTGIPPSSHVVRMNSSRLLHRISWHAFKIKIYSSTLSVGSVDVNDLGLKLRLLVCLLGCCFNLYSHCQRLEIACRNIEEFWIRIERTYLLAQLHLIVQKTRPFVVAFWTGSAIQIYPNVAVHHF